MIQINPEQKDHVVQSSDQMAGVSTDFIPFGFQYYRAPTPHEPEWEKDLAQIAAMGFNTVKLWVQWRSSNPEPERYRFDDVQKLMDLCRLNNLKVVLNVVFDSVPAWVFRQYPDCRMVTAAGQVLEPVVIPCRQLGGTGSLCFHHKEANHLKVRFLSETVRQFGNHPALWAWDLWNEPELTTSVKRELSFENQVCYCEHSLSAFRNWLRLRYGSVEALNNRWQRQYACWEDIEAPRCQGTFNDMVDWRMFFVETLTEELRRHAQTVRESDVVHPVMCHTVPPPVFNLITCGSDDFALADQCDLFGNSLGSSAWAADLLKSAAKGKKIINSEIHAMGGMTSMKPAKLEWNTLKQHILTPLARGITGFLFWQYRAEILGFEAPAWGHTYLDGSSTPWLEDTAALNRTIQHHRETLLKGVRQSDGIAILFCPEGQIASFSVYGNLKLYQDSIQGYHRLLHQSGYKVEFLHTRDLSRQLKEYKCLMMPYPLYLDRETCRCIEEWVKEGGILISECSFAAIQAETGLHSTKIPAYGFDRVFGVEELWIDSAEHIQNSYGPETVRSAGSEIPMHTGPEVLYGVEYRTEIRCDEGVDILVRFSDGGPAITSAGYGNGKAIWIGTLMGAAYWIDPVPDTLAFFSKLLKKFGLLPQVCSSEKGFRADMLEDETGRACIFVCNEGSAPGKTSVSIQDRNILQVEPWFKDAQWDTTRGSLELLLGPGEMQVFTCKLN